MTTTDQKTPAPRKGRQSYYRISSTVMSNDLITNSRQKIEPVPMLRQVGGVHYVPHFWNSVYRISAADTTLKNINTRIRYTSFNRRRHDDIDSGWFPECGCSVRIASFPYWMQSNVVMATNVVPRIETRWNNDTQESKRKMKRFEAGTLMLKLLYEYSHTTETVAVSIRLGDCVGILTERAVRWVGRQGKD